MEDVIHRQRYPRRNLNYRKKKKNPIGIRFLKKVFIQTFFCLCILMIILINKNINTAVTKFVAVKIENALFEEVKLKSIYTGIDDLVNNLLKNNLLEESITNEKQ